MSKIIIETASGADIEMRQIKYLNNIVEQDHRAIKRVVRPMLGFKTFRCARALIAGIETMHMIRKGQLDCPEGQASSAANQFYSLAFCAAADSAVCCAWRLHCDRTLDRSSRKVRHHGQPDVGRG